MQLNEVLDTFVIERQINRKMTLFNFCQFFFQIYD